MNEGNSDNQEDNQNSDKGFVKFTDNETEGKHFDFCSEPIYNAYDIKLNPFWP